MKRRRVVEYGTIRREDGTVFKVKDRVVAQALEDAQRRVEALEKVVKDGERFSHTQAIALKARTSQLARLQNRWWVRLGEALRLIRPGP